MRSHIYQKYLKPKLIGVRKWEIELILLTKHRNFRCSSNSSWNSYSKLLTDQGFYDLALLLCMKEDAVRPKSFFRTNYIGEIMFEQKRYFDAFRKFEQALVIDPNNQKAKDNLKMTELLLKKDTTNK